MKIRWKTLIIAVAIPLAVGGLAALLTMGSMESFSALNQPPLAPPGWLFPAVWTVLYTVMGIASYLIFSSGGNSGEVFRALKAYAVQLILNFGWSIVFFNLDLYYVAFAWILVLFAAILVCAYRFWRIRPAAGYLFIPYIIWVCFAAYLNLGIAVLN